ncbi:intraflagellar transport complex B protein 46 C terminal-domain-containing protein [Cladochytrium replicatum]|nr:intraflagellar transport complex B protein 46 C terminal-domain-containing protein [Cladochytrium replicatum]
MNTDSGIESKSLIFKSVPNNYFDEEVDVTHFFVPEHQPESDGHSSPDFSKGDSPPQQPNRIEESEDEANSPALSLPASLRTKSAQPSQSPLVMTAPSSPAVMRDVSSYGSNDGTSESEGDELGSEPPWRNRTMPSNAVPSDDIQDLFQYIDVHHPQETDLDTILRPFLPDFIPAIGDIDAFIKVPRPDLIADNLGLLFLDEPTTLQSDPSVLDLQLRAISKAQTSAPRTVHTLDPAARVQNPRALDTWIRSVMQLHDTHLPQQRVEFTRCMPNLEDLMQVWNPEVEDALLSIVLPDTSLEVSLASRVRIVTAILDVPVYDSVGGGKIAKESRSNIESLHVVFGLYSEFKNSHHFKEIVLGRSSVGFLGVAPAAEFRTEG